MSFVPLNRESLSVIINRLFQFQNPTYNNSMTFKYAVFFMYILIIFIVPYVVYAFINALIGIYFFISYVFILYIDYININIEPIEKPKEKPKEEFTKEFITLMESKGFHFTGEVKK